MPNRRQFLLGTGAVLLVSKLRSVRQPIQVASTPLPVGTEQINQLFVGGSNASDTNPGTASAPFATIQAAADVAQPGDTVRIRDGIYREGVTPAVGGTQGAPIVFEADTRLDNTLCEPVISGANLLNATWTLTADPIQSVGNNIYEATVALPRNGSLERRSRNAASANEFIFADQLFISSNMVHLAQWPKVTAPDRPLDTKANWGSIGPANTSAAEGYVNPVQWSAVGQNYTITDPGLPNVNLVGAMCHAACGYMASIDPVTSSGVGFLSATFGSSGGGSVLQSDWFTGMPAWYQVYGAKGLLTAANEWFYEAGTGKLFMWAPGGGVPQNVEYKARHWGFNLTNRPNVQLKNLNFFACEVEACGSDLRDRRAENIVIDTCRFKYLNHIARWETYANAAINYPNGYLWRREFGARYDPGEYAHYDQAGIRFPAPGCVIRNSVIKQAALTGIFLGGNNNTAENNYIHTVGYRGYGHDSLGVGYLNSATVTRNTVKWAPRSHTFVMGKDKDYSYNDLSFFMCTSIDGGAIYSSGREESAQDFGSPPEGWLYPGRRRKGSLWGTKIHHNWVHDDYLLHPIPNITNGLCHGIYLDADSDGAIVHHNVVWNVRGPCVMPGTDNKTFAQAGIAAPNSDVGYWNRWYNNTLVNVWPTWVDGPNRFRRQVGYYSAGLPNSSQYAAPESATTILNNFIVNPGFWPGAEVPMKPTDFALNYQGFDTPSAGAFLAVFAGGLPAIDGSEGSAAALKFVPASGSPLINRGTPINGILSDDERPSPGSDAITAGNTPNSGPPIVGVDDFIGLSPDCGAYEFGRAPWVGGCDLSQEFIDGEPWKRQWD